MMWREKYDPYLLFFLTLFALLSVLWIREADIMEARNFVSAREILTNHNWWTTTLNGNLRFEKPPFPTWITALWMQIIRNTSSEALLRIPNALFTACFSVYYYLKMKKIFQNREIAFYSSFVLVSTFFFVKTAAENTWDIYTYSFAFAAGLCYYAYLKTEQKQELYFFSLFLAFSVISKGPVGIYATLLPAVIASFVTERPVLKKNWNKILLFFLFGILFGSIWAISMYFQYPDYFSGIMEKEKETWSQSHKQGFFFYLDYILYLGTWIFFFLFAFFSSKKTREEKFFFLWHIMSLFFLSIIEMKKKRYGLPLYFTMSPILGIFLSQFLKKRWEDYNKKEKYLLQIQQYFLLFLSFAAICFLIYCYFGKHFIPQILFFLFLLLQIGSFWKLYRWKKERDSATKIVLGTGCFLLLFNLTCSWMIDVYLLNNKIAYQSQYSQLLKEQPFNSYSQDFEIEDVWKLGKQIHPMKEIPQKKEILYYGDKGLASLLSDYEIKQVFSEERENKTKRIYALERKENI